MTSAVLAGLLMRLALLPPEVVGAKGTGSRAKLSGAASNFSKLEKLDTRINRIDFSRFRDPLPSENLVPVGGYNAFDSNTLLDQMYLKVEQGQGMGRNKPYFRVSIDGKGALTLNGKISNDRKLTHIDITDEALEQIDIMIKAYIGV